MWHYPTTVTWLGGERGRLETPDRSAFEFTSPPEFGGAPDTWNPELMLVGAIESCMLLTALHFVKKAKVELKSYASEADGELDRTPQGLRFKSMTITVSAVVGKPEDIDAFKLAVAKAEKWCPVSNAVNFTVLVVAEAEVG